MIYEVRIQPEAEANLAEIADYIAKDSPENATNWLISMQRKISTLETFPEALPPARENPYHKRSLHQLVHGNYRVIYFVESSRVNVVSVRHSARQPHPPGTLE